jgi:electron transfer flavoprotein alpha subunit
LCEAACSAGAIRRQEQKAIVDHARCTICGACASICRQHRAIRLDRRTGHGHAPGDVWVFCEAGEDGRLLPVSRELLTAARGLAVRQGGETAALLFAATGASAAAEQAVAYGADRVYLVTGPVVARFSDTLFAGIAARLVREHRPAILLGGATAIGRALLPRIAIEVHTGLTADCTELDIDPETGLLLQTRPAFGGNILATITCNHHRPQMATVRPGVLPKPTPEAGCPGEVVVCPAPEAEPEPDLRWLDFRPRGRGDVDLHAAEIIVTAGYGVGGPKGVELVARLATALGGALGASRAVVDAGWLPYAHQVGQTGTTVQPKLYVACGVSGAIQHLVGMQNSGTIVAINKDPAAAILQHADIALVGDVHEIVPCLLRKLDGQTGTGSLPKRRLQNPMVTHASCLRAPYPEEESVIPFDRCE